METSLEEKIAKYSICKTKTVSIRLDNYQSVKNLTKEIEEFVKKYNLDPSSTSVDFLCDDNDIRYAIVSGQTDKPLDELELEVQDRERWMKIHLEGRRKLYEQLKKEFGE